MESSENGRKLKARLYFPKNDNLIPVLEDNLGDEIMRCARAMWEEKRYRESIPINGSSKLELVTGRGEDIAFKVIIENRDPLEIGITGSDFVLARVLESPEFYRYRRGNSQFSNLRVEEAGRLYVRDLGEIVEEDLEPGETIEFSGEKYEATMSVLEHVAKVPSTLCLLGGNDISYEDLIERRKSAGKKVSIAFESRFEQLAKAFLEKEQRIQGVEFAPVPYMGTTEAHMRHGGEPDEEGRADLGIEIGQTFKTAEANKLMKLREIMRTYPVQVNCHPIEDRSERWSVQRIRDILSRKDIYTAA